MGTADKDPGTGGFQPKGLGNVFQVSGTGADAFRVRYVGARPPHGTGPGKLPTGCCKADTGKISEEKRGGGMGVTTTGRSDGGFGI